MSEMFLNYALWTFIKQFTERKSSRSKILILILFVVLMLLFPDTLPFSTFRATAYLGLLDKFSLQSGETVLVNGAAGAVGNIAGQIFLCLR